MTGLRNAIWISAALWLLVVASCVGARAADLLDAPSLNKGFSLNSGKLTGPATKKLVIPTPPRQKMTIPTPPHSATAAAGPVPGCSQFGGYPFSQNGCLNAQDINNAIDLSIGPLPPANGFGLGARRGHQWLDTSTTPAATLRICVNSLGCGTSYVPGDWALFYTLNLSTGAMNIPWISGGGGGMNLDGSNAQAAALFNILNVSTLKTGTGNVVLSSNSTIVGLTVTGSFNAAGLVTNNDLVNPSMTINGTLCTLGGSCTPSGGSGGMNTNASNAINPTAIQSLTGSNLTYSGTTLTAGGALTVATFLELLDTSAAHFVKFGATSSAALTADRTVTVNVVDGNRALKLGSNLTVMTDPGGVTGAIKANGSGTFSQAGTSDLSDIGTFNLNTSGTLSTTNSTASTTIATGAAVVTGGLGVGGAANVGGTLAVGGALSSAYNGSSTLPASVATAGYALTNNYYGDHSVNLWNTVNNATYSFEFNQKTGSGTTVNEAAFHSDYATYNELEVYDTGNPSHVTFLGKLSGNGHGYVGNFDNVPFDVYVNNVAVASFNGNGAAVTGDVSALTFNGQALGNLAYQNAPLDAPFAYPLSGTLRSGSLGNGLQFNTATGLLSTTLLADDCTSGTCDVGGGAAIAGGDGSGGDAARLVLVGNGHTNTLAAAGTTGFGAGWAPAGILNNTASDATITSPSSFLGGSGTGTQVLHPGCFMAGPRSDGTNYQTSISCTTAALLNQPNQLVTGGANVQETDLGTIGSAGSVTINCGTRPDLKLINNSSPGGMTIAAPSNTSGCNLLITNGASPGAITFTGFSVGTNTGDPITTTTGNKFILSIFGIGGSYGYRTAAMQ